MSNEQPSVGRQTPNGRLARWFYREPQGLRSGLVAILAGGAISALAALYMVHLRLSWIAIGLHIVVHGIAELFPTDRQISANLLRVWATGVAVGVILADVVGLMGL